MNSEVARSILAVFPAKRKKKGFSHVQEPVKLNHIKTTMRATRSLQVTPIPKSRIGYWVSHRGSWHNLGNMSGLVGENVVEKRV